MIRLVAVLVLFGSLLSLQSTSASPTRDASVAMDPEKIVRALTGSVNIPTDWDGVWSTLDCVFVCGGGPLNVSSGLDTICGGQRFSEAPPSSPFTFTCKGTATATTITGTCTGGGEVAPDCQVSIVINYESTRTGTTYLSVTTVNSTFSGTGIGCDLLLDSCTRIVSHGTRMGPAPVGYCTTAAKRTSWGKLKTIYR